MLDAFSFALRRHKNMSHFSLIPILLLPVMYDTITLIVSSYAIFAMLQIAVMIWLAAIAFAKAKQHNRPAAVEEIFPLWWCKILAGFTGFNLFAGYFMGSVDPWSAFSSLTGIAMVLLVGTPGMKVHYDPDDLSFQPV